MQNTDIIISEFSSQEIFFFVIQIKKMDVSKVQLT